MLLLHRHHTFIVLPFALTQTTPVPATSTPPPSKSTTRPPCPSPLTPLLARSQPSADRMLPPTIPILLHSLPGTLERSVRLWSDCVSDGARPGSPSYSLPKRSPPAPARARSSFDRTSDARAHILRRVPHVSPRHGHFYMYSTAQRALRPSVYCNAQTAFLALPCQCILT
ncbi:hypothetical protein BD413DRAFT_181689 [Trametes elegans]|nr:hypothetical protein BD413DRAFT_181689 [Trametes elegans]